VQKHAERLWRDKTRNMGWNRQFFGQSGPETVWPQRGVEVLGAAV